MSNLDDPRVLFVASLRPVEIPPGYWVNLSVYTTSAIGVLGLLLALYLSVS